MNKNPAINSNDEIDWLIILVGDDFDDEIVNEAKKKLTEYGFSDDDIKDRYNVLKRDKIEQSAFEKAWRVQLNRNQFERYSIKEKIGIFLWGPYRLFKHYDSGLINLYKQNYKIQFKQKIILLLLGTCFWIGLLIGGYKYFEYKRLKEIEKIDISDWEKNRIIK